MVRTRRMLEGHEPVTLNVDIAELDPGGVECLQEPVRLPVRQLHEFPDAVEIRCVRIRRKL